MHQKPSGLDPLGKLKRSPDPPSHIRGVGPRRGGEGMGREGRGREVRDGREGKRTTERSPSLKFSTTPLYVSDGLI